MSVIGNRHTLVKLTKESKAADVSQRLVRVIAKKTQAGEYSPYLQESLCVSVPKILDVDVMAAINQLLPHVGTMIEEAQDVIIRELRLTTGVNEVDDAEISIAKVIEYLDAEAKGSRLTKESLEKWFVEGYSEVAAEFICAANKWEMQQMTEKQVEVVVQKTNLIASMFSGWSSGKYAPDIPKCRAMIKFGEFAEPVADERMIGFVERAKRELVKRQEEMSADALGF